MTTGRAGCWWSIAGPITAERKRFEPGDPERPSPEIIGCLQLIELAPQDGRRLLHHLAGILADWH